MRRMNVSNSNCSQSEKKRASGPRGSPDDKRRKSGSSIYSLPPSGVVFSCVPLVFARQAVHSADAHRPAARRPPLALLLIWLSAPLRGPSRVCACASVRPPGRLWLGVGPASLELVGRANQPSAAPRSQMAEGRSRARLVGVVTIGARLACFQSPATSHKPPMPMACPWPREADGAQEQRRHTNMEAFAACDEQIATSDGLVWTRRTTRED